MIIIQGLRYDEKSSYLKGAALAPPLIRKALHSGAVNYHAENGQAIEPASITDLGDFEPDTYFDIEKITRKNSSLPGKLLTLGGDHSITYPVIKSLASRYPKLDILQIDAHPDLYDHYDKDPYSHACPFARIMEDGLANRLVQVGIRTLNPHQEEQAKKFKVEIHQMKDIARWAIPKFANPVYISLDLDAIDPAYAPGVSHQEPGGLSSRQVIRIIQELDAEVVGADIVEYNPTRDIQDMTAFLAAKLLKEILAKMVSSGHRESLT